MKRPPNPTPNIKLPPDPVLPAPPFWQNTPGCGVWYYRSREVTLRLSFDLYTQSWRVYVDGQEMRELEMDRNTPVRAMARRLDLAIGQLIAGRLLYAPGVPAGGVACYPNKSKNQKTAGGKPTVTGGTNNI